MWAARWAAALLVLMAGGNEAAAAAAAPPAPAPVSGAVLPHARTHRSRPYPATRRVRRGASSRQTRRRVLCHPRHTLPPFLSLLRTSLTDL